MALGFLDLESRELYQAVPELCCSSMGVSGKDHTLYILVSLEKFLMSEMGLEEHTASTEVHCK